MRTISKFGSPFGLSLFLCASLTLTAFVQAQTAEAAPTQQTQSEAATPETAPLVITNKEVIAVQAALLGRGYFQTRPNGVLDGKTREALRAWQTDHNLAASGRIDRATLESLEVSYPATGKEADSAR